jgi:hypothetical protein
MDKRLSVEVRIVPHRFGRIALANLASVIHSTRIGARKKMVALVWTNV